MQIPVLEVWVGSETAFLAGFQGTWMLLVQSPHFEEQVPGLSQPSCSERQWKHSSDSSGKHLE